MLFEPALTLYPTNSLLINIVLPTNLWLLNKGTAIPSVTNVNKICLVGLILIICPACELVKSFVPCIVTSPLRLLPSVAFTVVPALGVSHENKPALPPAVNTLPPLSIPVAGTCLFPSVLLWE
jgi:hypothetical protein